MWHLRNPQALQQFNGLIDPRDLSRLTLQPCDHCGEGELAVAAPIRRVSTPTHTWLLRPESLVVHGQKHIDYDVAGPACFHFQQRRGRNNVRPLPACITPTFTLEAPSLCGRLHAVQEWLVLPPTRHCDRLWFCACVSGGTGEVRVKFGGSIKLSLPHTTVPAGTPVPMCRQ